MQSILSSIVCLSLLGGWQRAPADENVEQTKAKLQVVRQQLEDLRRQEQAFVKQLAKAQAAQRNDSYIKAEVKGILRYEGVYYPPPFSSPEGQVVKSWTITVEDTKWILHFGDNQAFLDRAKTNEGKRVVVTGRVGTRVAFVPPANGRFQYAPLPPAPTGLNVATLEAATK
jgi:hypothetical protein